MCESLRVAACRVVSTLQGAGYTTYFAGGCVRDRLLGREPKDYDIATGAHPDQVLQLFPHAITTGKCFGVVRVRTEKGYELEIATFRTDVGYSDGRRPDAVRFATPQEDAQRRDFTINAMFEDPVTDQIIDFVGGRQDVAAGVVRCVGDPSERFREDRLRMLRAVRFSAVLGFTLDETTAAAIREHAAAIHDVSAERIQVELTRMLLEADRAGDAVLLLEQVGLLKQVLPEVAACRGQEQPPQFHPEGDVLTHTVIMLNAMDKSRTPELAWSTLLHDIGKPPTATLDGERIRFNGHAEMGAQMARKRLAALKMSNRLTDTVVRCVKRHMRFCDVTKMKRSTLRKLIGSETFETELELHRLDCMSSHGKLDNHAFLTAFEEELANEPVLPDPWISGHDVIALGVPPGPAIGRWLRVAYARQLDGLDPTPEAQLDWLKRQLNQPI
jgi:poly(A) polymerase